MPLPPPQLPGQPLTALAPMQDVTDLAFMRVIARYGAPDYLFTEFFRVHAQSQPERHILRSIDENDTGRPVFAQLIGEDPEAAWALTIKRNTVAVVSDGTAILGLGDLGPAAAMPVTPCSAATAAIC